MSQDPQRLRALIEYRERNARRGLRRIWRLEVLIAIPLALAIFMLLSAVVPFRPYEFYAFEGIPEEACSGEAVEVYLDRAIEPKPYQRVKAVKGEGYWRDTSNPSYVVADSSASLLLASELDESVSGGEAGKAPRDIYPAPSIKQVPNTPGEYRAGLVITVSGRVGFVPRHQVIETTADTITTVDEC